MLDISYTGAAIAGLLSFLSPCILPMVPFYLSYMAGLSVRELRDGDTIAPGAQRRLVVQALAFAFGVTTIFVMLGLGATALGRVFLQWRETLSWVAGGVLILFGLHFLGILKIGLFYREARVQSDAKPTTLIGAYVMGLAFGFGWTPCVGPALAAILMVASGMGDLWRGGLLLLVYGLSMTLPFVIAALFAGPFLGWVARHRAMMGHVEKVMGVMLIAFGILIATNSVNLIADWMIRNFDWSATLK
ncbi:MAG: cytochrome c biogenesis protein CcdA [Pseudotabrizicola sp.]|uniref:cytochrome c biogenesis CcdA family protein n=1 Tax=Pseudotabrizicola sp. TaxID=2939647 RepID=UPI00271FC693|nr:cytochrome c biogenesis protein CcdA [Pseudotabrizicola sp.]MDO8883611.1 cytochrome c biogenesis protein CcdA [Pseudotabrizicola sp.]MDP2081264.1 cytochrome c biogenesis protein CcdA [Pseudotabrizicola sp.]MDZ7576117.1 cytochrome c biogenesis protein CcdA [Pseudotabrizicola sp.]